MSESEDKTINPFHPDFKSVQATITYKLVALALVLKGRIPLCKEIAECEWYSSAVDPICGVPSPLRSIGERLGDYNNQNFKNWCKEVSDDVTTIFSAAFHQILTHQPHQNEEHVRILIDHVRNLRVKLNQLLNLKEAPNLFRALFQVWAERKHEVWMEMTHIELTLPNELLTKRCDNLLIKCNDQSEAITSLLTAFNKKEIDVKSMIYDEIRRDKSDINLKIQERCRVESLELHRDMLIKLIPNMVNPDTPLEIPPVKRVDSVTSIEERGSWREQAGGEAPLPGPRRQVSNKIENMRMKENSELTRLLSASYQGNVHPRRDSNSSQNGKSLGTLEDKRQKDSPKFVAASLPDIIGANFISKVSKAVFGSFATTLGPRKTAGTEERQDESLIQDDPESHRGSQPTKKRRPTYRMGALGLIHGTGDNAS